MRHHHLLLEITLGAKRDFSIDSIERVYLFTIAHDMFGYHKCNDF
jgi:hypothetical protein